MLYQFISLKIHREQLIYCSCHAASASKYIIIDVSQLFVYKIKDGAQKQLSCVQTPPAAEIKCDVTLMNCRSLDLFHGTNCTAWNKVHLYYSFYFLAFTLCSGVVMSPRHVVFHTQSVRVTQVKQFSLFQTAATLASQLRLYVAVKAFPNTIVFQSGSIQMSSDQTV